MTRHIQAMNHQATGTLAIPPHDYRAALDRAIAWLGDRYLLATPLNRRATERPKYWTAQQHAAAHDSRSGRR
jgi:hypothetical protein